LHARPHFGSMQRSSVHERGLVSPFQMKRSSRLASCSLSCTHSSRSFHGQTRQASRGWNSRGETGSTRRPSACVARVQSRRGRARGISVCPGRKETQLWTVGHLIAATRLSADERPAYMIHPRYQRRKDGMIHRLSFLFFSTSSSFTCLTDDSCTDPLQERRLR
jgi:hypothetical protein